MTAPDDDRNPTMADTSPDIDKLRRLASACDPMAPRWYDWQRLGEGPITDPADIALISAVTPQVVVALVDELKVSRSKLAAMRGVAFAVAPVVKMALGGDES